MFAASKHCETVSLVSRRDEHGKYHLEVLPELENFPSGDKKADVTRVNQRIEQAINAAPEQYMWLHRRFKTRPPMKIALLFIKSNGITIDNKNKNEYQLCGSGLNIYHWLRG